MGSIYVICSRQCPNGDGIYTLLNALYKYSTSITNQPTNQRPIIILLIGRDGQSHGQRALAGGVLDFTHRIPTPQCTLGFVKRNYSNVKADVWVNYSESYKTVYNMLVPYNSREWFRVENPVLFPIGVMLKSNENTFLVPFATSFK